MLFTGVKCVPNSPFYFLLRSRVSNIRFWLIKIRLTAIRCAVAAHPFYKFGVSINKIFAFFPIPYWLMRFHVEIFVHLTNTQQTLQCCVHKTEIRSILKSASTDIEFTIINWNGYIFSILINFSASNPRFTESISSWTGSTGKSGIVLRRWAWSLKVIIIDSPVLSNIRLFNSSCNSLILRWWF